MSEGRTYLPWAGAAVGLVAALILPFALRSEDPPTDSPVPTPAASVSASPSASPVAPEGPTQPDLPDLAKTVDEFLKHVPVKGQPRPKEVLERLRTSEPKLDLVDYRLALEKAIRGSKDGSKEAANMLLHDMNDFGQKPLFQTALALAARLDGEGAKALLAGQEKADPKVRPHVVFALRGSADPEVDQAFVDLYSRDSDPKVRAQAAFALGERGDRIDPLLLERARQTARDDLSPDDPALVKAAADVLGSSSLDGADKERLIAVLAGDADPARRIQALRALATAQVPPGELVPVLTRVADDSTASEELRSMARAILERLSAPPAEPPRDEDD